MNTTQWLGIEAKKMPPTQKHRPAVWELMLGMVEARNAEGEVKNFGYDYAGAMEFAGYDWNRDPRLAKSKHDYGRKGPGYNRLALWIQ